MLAMAQAVGIGVGEPVLGPGDPDELVVRPSRIHFRFECRHLLRRDHAVGLTVFYQDLRPDHPWLGRRLGHQRAMEAHHGVELLTPARGIQHHLAAEAVAHGGQLVLVGVGLQFQQFQASVEAPGRCLGVFHRRRHECLGVLRMVGVLAVAIHVDGQGVVAQRREITGTTLGVVVQPPPLMHHHHAGAPAFDGVVVGVVADQGSAISILIADLAGLHRRLGEGGTAQQGQRKQVTHGQSSFFRHRSVRSAEVQAGFSGGSGRPPYSSPQTATTHSTGVPEP